MRYNDQVYPIPTDKRSISTNGIAKAIITAAYDVLPTFSMKLASSVEIA